MIFTSPMLFKIVFSFKPLCTLHTIPLAQPRKVFRRLDCLMLSEVFCRSQVGVNLIEVSALRISLLFTCRSVVVPYAHRVRRFVLLLLMEPMARCR